MFWMGYPDNELQEGKVNFFRRIRKIIFPLVLVSAGGYLPSAISANIYSYLWVTNNSASGNVSYSGPAIGQISGKVNSLYTGTMIVNYNDCSTTSQTKVYYKADDRWVYFPKTVNIGGVSVAVDVDTLPSGFSRLTYGNDYTLLKLTGSVRSHFELGACSAIGKTYPINYTYPSFSVTLDVSALPSGNFSGSIPMRLAYAEYWGVRSTDITKFSDDLAFQYTMVKEIPYSINITNKCSVSPTEISLNHGRLSANTAEGHSVSRNVSITCDAPASLKVSVLSRSTPRTLYSDGVGVGLGNGWDSVLQIGDSGLSDYSLTDKTISVSGGSISMPVISTLKKNGAVSAGDISGSMVVSLKMD